MSGRSTAGPIPVMSSVYPSAGAFATVTDPTTPPLPDRFSTMTGCPSAVDRFCAMARPARSTAVPGEKATTRGIACVGHAGASSARAGPGQRSSRKPKTATITLGPGRDICALSAYPVWGNHPSRSRPPPAAGTAAGSSPPSAAKLTGWPAGTSPSKNTPMELRHLRYFVAVAEELHFSRAAAKLNIATPTLSAQIQALESMLGAQLFTRKTRSVALTHVGKRFLEEARATLKQADQAELVGRRAARGDLGSIAIGYVLSAAGAGTVTPGITDFRKSHPDVSFQLHKMETIPQMKALVDGTLDLAFARLPDRS